MRIYLSGPITGTQDYVERFLEAEQKFQKVPRLQVVNPAAVSSMLPSDYSHSEYMKVMLKILETCDFMYQLEGWEGSNGCMQEFEAANRLGIKIW